MRVVLFCHSLLSDDNHGSAHFLRGVVTELAARGHDVHVCEPEDARSVQRFVAEDGEGALAEAQRVHPAVRPVRYRRHQLDLDAILGGASLVLVHDWNDPELVARIGERRRRDGRSVLLFHDTHHRSVKDAGAMERHDLSGYDGVLAISRAARDLYLERGWARRAFVWIDDFGDEESTARGRAAVLARHTVAHRVDELLAICGSLGPSA